MKPLLCKCLHLDYENHFIFWGHPLHYITWHLLDTVIQSDLHTQYCGQSPQEQFGLKCLRDTTTCWLQWGLNLWPPLIRTPTHTPLHHTHPVPKWLALEPLFLIQLAQSPLDFTIYFIFVWYCIFHHEPQPEDSSSHTSFWICRTAVERWVRSVNGDKSITLTGSNIQGYHVLTLSVWDIGKNKLLLQTPQYKPSQLNV